MCNYCSCWFIPKLNNITVIKNSLFDMIQKESGTSFKEMYQVFNMGHRMELYVPENQVDNLISIAESYGIDAKRIGHTESSDSNRLTLTNNDGRSFSY